MTTMLAEIVIPHYITRVQTAKKRRPKYYKKNDKIPKKYQGENFLFNKKGILVDKGGNKIIKNKAFANTPRYQVLSGNNLISGYGSPHIRAKIARELKEFYLPFVQEFVNTSGPITLFPLRVTWDMYTVNVREGNWDASNMSFYYKYFEDTIVDAGLIPDDTVKYITWAPGPKIIPIKSWEDRKFIFRFYHDTRPEILNEFI